MDNYKTKKNCDKKTLIKNFILTIEMRCDQIVIGPSILYNIENILYYIINHYNISIYRMNLTESDKIKGVLEEPI